MAEPLDREITGLRRPLYLVGTDTEQLELIEDALTERQLSQPVETLTPADAAATLESATPASVVWLDAGEADQTVPSTLRALDGTAVDCPFVVVGDSVDTAAAYDAGATDVVPLSVETHADQITDQLVDIVERRADGTLVSDLLDDINDGIVLHHPETGEILSCNERFYEMLGYDPAADEITLADIAGHDEEFTRDRALSQIRRAATGEAVSFEWRDPTNDGGAIWVEVKLDAATLAGEEYVVASVRDITERKGRQHELRESRETLERLHDITGDPDRSFDNQLRDLLELGTDTYGTESGYLAELDPDEGSFRVVEAVGDHPLIQPGMEAPLEETYCRRILDDEKSTAMSDARTEMASDPAYERFGLACYFGTEVVVDGDRYGTLCFADTEARTTPFSGVERALLDQMAQWLGRELERQEYVAELEQTQQRLSRTFERVDDAFFALDEDWHVRYVNEAGAAVLRGAMNADYTMAELHGKHLWTEVPAAVETEFYQQYHRAMDEQESTTFEEYYEPMDTWFEVRAYPDSEGISVYFTDITERKEREQELYITQRVLEEASFPLTLADPSLEDDPLVFVNEAFEELTGYDAEEALGRNCRFLQGEETDPETVEELSAAIEAEETFTTEMRNYRKDGTPFWNRLEITPIYDDDGTLLRYLGGQADVTDQRRAADVRQELLSTTQELMGADSRSAVAERVAEAAASILDHTRTAVYLQSSDGGHTLEASAGDGDAGEIPDVTGLVREALDRGEAVHRDDIDGDPEAVLGVPLGAYGVLVVETAQPDGFSVDETEWARLLAVSATSSLDRTARRVELERYETLFETVQDMLYVIDEEGYIEMVSEPLAAFAGTSREQLAGAHVSDILSEETVSDAERLIVDLIVTPEAVSNTYEGELVDEAGDRHPIEIELSLLPYEEDFRGTVGVVRDISERQQREEELAVFQRAITDAGIGLAMYDETGQFEYVNDHCAQLLGRTRTGAESTPVWEWFAPSDEESFRSYWDSFADNETRTTETDLQRVDGSSIPVETVTTAVEIDGKRHHLVTVQEVTARRERRQQTEVLHRIMRHNLRNDLTVVLGYAETLMQALDGEHAEYAEQIQETAIKLRGLAETTQSARDIIDGDRNRRPVDVTEILHSEADKLPEGVETTVETDLPQAEEVLADDSLRLALGQLFENAVEHNDSARPTVRASARPTTGRSGWITIEIADNGPGIPEHETAVFTAGTETSLEHGSGIGLWVVHWVVTRYGGELDFRTDGEGTIVEIRLPAAEETDSPE